MAEKRAPPLLASTAVIDVHCNWTQSCFLRAVPWQELLPSWVMKFGPSLLSNILESNTWLARQLQSLNKKQQQQNHKQPSDCHWSKARRAIKDFRWNQRAFSYFQFMGKYNYFIFKGILQLFHTLCMAESLPLLLAEPSLWVILSCNNLTLEKFPDFPFSGPLFYSRNACHEIGTQAEHLVCLYQH